MRGFPSSFRTASTDSPRDESAAADRTGISTGPRSTRQLTPASPPGEAFAAAASDVEAAAVAEGDAEVTPAADAEPDAEPDADADAAADPDPDAAPTAPPSPCGPVPSP